MVGRFWETEVLNLAKIQVSSGRMKGDIQEREYRTFNIFYAVVQIPSLQKSYDIIGGY